MNRVFFSIETVPPNNFLGGGTVPPNSFFGGGTLPPNSHFLYANQIFQPPSQPPLGTRENFKNQDRAICPKQKFRRVNTF